MKKMVVSILTIIIALLCCSSTIAHSGNTDGNGGHTDHSTGEYHYHHGYPAHDHPNGVCPYGGVYITSSNSSEHSNDDADVQGYLDQIRRLKNDVSKLQSELSVATKQMKMYSTEISELTDKSNSLSEELSNTKMNLSESRKREKNISIWFAVTASTLFVMLVCLSVNRRKRINEYMIDEQRHAKEMNTAKEKIDTLSSLNRLNEYSDPYSALKEQYQKSAKDAEQLMVLLVPSDTEIGRDGLPKEKGAVRWGEKYTVYASHTGSCYHRQSCSTLSTTPIHSCLVKKYNLRPCGKCLPQLPDLKWFAEYLDIKREVQRCASLSGFDDNMIKG